MMTLSEIQTEGLSWPWNFLKEIGVNLSKIRDDVREEVAPTLEFMCYITMPEKMKKIVLLRYKHMMEFGEIGKKVFISERKVKRTLREAIEHISKFKEYPVKGFEGIEDFYDDRMMIAMEDVIEQGNKLNASLGRGFM